VSKAEWRRRHARYGIIGRCGDFARVGRRGDNIMIHAIASIVLEHGFAKLD